MPSRRICRTCGMKRTRFHDRSSVRTKTTLGRRLAAADGLEPAWATAAPRRATSAAAAIQRRIRPHRHREAARVALQAELTGEDGAVVDPQPFGAVVPDRYRAADA